MNKFILHIFHSFSLTNLVQSTSVKFWFLNRLDLLSSDQKQNLGGLLAQCCTRQPLDWNSRVLPEHSVLALATPGDQKYRFQVEIRLYKKFGMVLCPTEARIFENRRLRGDLVVTGWLKVADPWFCGLKWFESVLFRSSPLPEVPRVMISGFVVPKSFQSCQIWICSS